MARGGHRIMAEDYWLARNPGKTSEDYANMLAGLPPGRSSDIGGGVDENSPAYSMLHADTSAVGGGYGKKRGLTASRGEMDLTKGRQSTLLTG